MNLADAVSCESCGKSLYDDYKKEFLEEIIHESDSTVFDFSKKGFTVGQPKFKWMEEVLQGLIDEGSIKLDKTLKNGVRIFRITRTTAWKRDESKPIEQKEKIKSKEKEVTRYVHGNKIKKWFLMEE